MATSFDDVVRACNTLFGDGVVSPSDLRRKVTLPGLKATYRKRIRESHPDRAQQLGRKEGELHEEFKSIQAAFELLQVVLADAQQQVAQEEPRRLRFAEFRVRTGRISRETMFDALRWQKQQRPSVGRIAVNAGYLTDAQVWEILHERRRTSAFADRFATFACKRGYLTEAQRTDLLILQSRKHRRIGEYFIEHRLFDAETLASFAVEQSCASPL